MPSEDTSILKLNQDHKSDKISFIIYADLESLIYKNDGCKNKPGKLLSAAKLSSLKDIENKHDV